MTDNWTPVTLPYRRTGSELQATLPTAAEIRSSQGKKYKSAQRTIVVTSPGIIVKYGRFVREREGQALLFLEHIDVPTPRLYAMFKDDGETFLVMEYFEGDSLETLWEDLTDEHKDEIMNELRSIFIRLRKVPCPWPFKFCGIDGRAMPHHLFYSPTKDQRITGPFADERALVNGLILRYKDICSHNQHFLSKARFYERHWPDHLQSHGAVLTHGDIQKKNIVLVKSKDQADRIIIVDWEDAGWFPDYWEYLMAHMTFGLWSDDWSDKIEKALPAWPAETAMMGMIYHDLFFYKQGVMEMSSWCVVACQHQTIKDCQHRQLAMLPKTGDQICFSQRTGCMDQLSVPCAPVTRTTSIATS